MSIFESYRRFMETYTDPRTNNWWLVMGPGPLLLLLGTYLYFCISLGPRWMRDRKPFDLKYPIMVYNVIQIAMSIFIVNEGLMGGWWQNYNLACQPVDYSDNPIALRMARGVWWYYFAKIIELLDTVFFVLRKKNRQVSFLHLFHHTMMPICAWIGVRFLPGGHGTSLGVLNSFIHIIMYTYYLISGLGPQYQKFLWWKKHLTTLQMIQFVIIFVHNFQVMFRECSYPKTINFLLFVHAGIFLYMFGVFYVKTYKKNRRQAAAKAEDSADTILKADIHKLQNGLNGINGLNGVKEIKAINEINGIKTVNGVNGSNGVSGINGVKGVNGVNGVNGMNGLHHRSNGVKTNGHATADC